MSPALDVWWDRRLVGQLTQDRDGELGFVYSPDWLRREGWLRAGRNGVH